MVEKAPKYRGIFKSGFPRVSLLGDTEPYLNTDVTNPRELYAMLSEARHQRALLASVRVNSHTGAKLPPLETSLEMQFRSLGKYPQTSSYPDLASFRSETGARADRPQMRRSSSLQDLQAINLRHNHTHTTKKLKPILRDNSTTKNVGEQGEKAGVKFGQKEVHLIRDSPLPPIEGAGREASGRNGLSFSSSLEVTHEEKGRWGSGHSPRHQRRGGAELSSEIFPRGQPVEVKKPATPTYDDYPEAYWELRSPTVQDPSDLKEDMIDRDRYRLKQISSLHLKAINRELVASKLDSYRRWQQQMLAVSPPMGTASKQDSARSSVTPTATGPPVPSAKNGRQLRMSAPLQNDALAVAATSITPNTHPETKKRTESSKTRGPDLATIAGTHITEDEFRHRQKIHAAAKGEDGTPEPEGKPIKPTVVNLCIDPDRSSNSPTSDVYTGIKRITFGPRPSSDRARTQPSLHDEGQEDHTNVPKPPESFSVASINATLGSSQSHRPNRATSAPTESFVNGSTAVGGDTTDTDSSLASKKILKKFNQLQVFSEKYFTRETASMDPWEVVRARPAEKGPYLPKSRPPTYKLDLRKWPSHHHHALSRTGTGEGMGGIAERPDDCLPLTNERGAIPRLGNLSPAKSETPSLSFRFRDGVVIVSRQEKKPKVT